MLSLFQRSHKKKSSGSSIRAKANPHVEQNVDQIAAQIPMNDAEREVYQYSMPTAEQGMTNLIAAHKPGTRFQYVALTGRDEESLPARLRRITTMQPRTNKSSIPLEKVPKLRLIEDTEQFNLSMAIPSKGKDYIRLASVAVVYIPLVSSQSVFSKAVASLIDNRFVGDKVVQSVRFTTNLPEKKEMTMDYCIPRESAKSILISFSREQAVLEMGEQWGACQLTLQLEESDFPYVENFKEVVAVTAVPEAILSEYDVNPNHVTTAILENHRSKLRDMYLRGDIADETAPIENKASVVKYSKSSIGVKDQRKGEEDPKFSDTKPGWEQMKGFRKPLIPEDQISYDPIEEDDISDHEPVRKIEDTDVETGNSQSGTLVRPPTPPKGILKPQQKLRFSNNVDNVSPFGV
nr:MAG: movement protein [Inner Mongolia phenui-like virus 2]